MRHFVVVVGLIIFSSTNYAWAAGDTARHALPGDAFNAKKGYALFRMQIVNPASEGYALDIANFDISKDTALIKGVRSEGLFVTGGRSMPMEVPKPEFRPESSTESNGIYSVLELDPGYYSFGALHEIYPRDHFTLSCLNSESFIFEVKAGTLSYVGDLSLQSNSSATQDGRVSIIEHRSPSLFDPERNEEAAHQYVKDYFPQFKDISTNMAVRKNKKPLRNWIGKKVCG